jgi:hypothetical protein
MYVGRVVRRESSITGKWLLIRKAYGSLFYPARGLDPRIVIAVANAAIAASRVGS